MILAAKDAGRGAVGPNWSARWRTCGFTGMVMLSHLDVEHQRGHDCLAARFGNPESPKSRAHRPVIEQTRAGERYGYWWNQRIWQLLIILAIVIMLFGASDCAPWAATWAAR